MSDDLRRLAQIVAAETGIHITPERMRWLVTAARGLTGGEGPGALVQAIDDPSSSSRVLQRLIDEITVRETFFLRDGGQLDAIDWLHRLESARHAGSSVIRVWCAACASGEEAYSLALLAGEALGWPAPIHVLGTDISSAALEQARCGRYGPRAVRTLAVIAVSRHFERDGAAYQVGETLRGSVQFARHNLVRDPPPRGGGFDLVLCRNVLMYFEPEAVERAVRTLRRALAPGGQLVLGTVDRLCVGQSPEPVRERRSPRRHGPLRRRAGPPEVERDADPVERARRLADAGRLGPALEALRAAPAEVSMDPAARFLEGTLLLACGDATGAVTALRAALYAEPSFALAAFQLGRAHDALQDEGAARNAYQRALLTIDPDDTSHDSLLGTMDLADMARACEARLRT